MTTIDFDNDHKFFYISIKLLTGETIVGPATLFYKVNDEKKEEFNFEIAWKDAEFLVINYPIKLVFDLPSQNQGMIFFSKYDNFNVSNMVFFNVKNIQNVNYISDDLVEFYKEAKIYLNKGYEKVLDNELKEYTKNLKQRNLLTEDQRKQTALEMLKIMLSNNTPTVH